MTILNPICRGRVVIEAWLFAGLLLTTIGSAPAFSQPNTKPADEIEN
jgi:hypothetical protein